MKVGEVIRRVKSVIDEHTSTDTAGYLGDEYSSDLREVIVDKIPYALNWVYLNAQANLLTSDMVSAYTGGTEESDKVLKMTFGHDNMVTVILPDDFLRLVSAKLSSWFYAPTPVDESSPVALMQQGRVTKGCPDMPVCVLGTSGNRNALFMYTAESEKDTLDISLVCKPDTDSDMDEDSEITVSEKLLKSFIYYIAYLTTLAYRDTSASAFLQVAMDEIGLRTDKNIE